MKTVGIVNDKIVPLILDSGDKKETLNKILELFDELSNDNKNIDNKILYDAVLYECGDYTNWIYDKKDVDLIDLKRELDIRINRFMPFCEEEKYENSYYIGEAIHINYFHLIADYYAFKCSILSTLGKNEFAANLNECFPRVYFHGDMKSTINTLYTGFENIRGEIVSHLAAINSYNPKFLSEKYVNMSNQNLCKEFEKDTEIKCSPQSKRASVKQLTYEFEKDKIDSQGEDDTVELCCELHTKFRTINRDRKKQDRIYFHQGKTGVKDGRSIVIHIGRHL